MTMVSEWIDDDSCGAVFDSTKKYRYSLWRRWNWRTCRLSICSDMVAFIGLNPSTADERKNDPTVMRCIRFAESWKFNGMVMLNAFGFRATDPKEMKSQENPIGDDNDRAIEFFINRCAMVVCCWGNHGIYLNRSNELRSILKKRMVFHLGLNKNGEPKHPLYLSGDSQLIKWNI